MLPYILVILWFIGIAILSGRGLICSIVLTFIMVVSAIVVLREQRRIYRTCKDIRDAKLLDFAFFPTAVLIMSLCYVPGMEWLNYSLLGLFGLSDIYWMASKEGNNELKKKFKDDVITISTCIIVMFVTDLPYYI